MTQTQDQPREELSKRTITEVREAVHAGDSERLVDLLDPLHAADVADIMEQVRAGERAQMVEMMGAEIDGDILSELEESIREEVIDQLEPAVLAEAVRELDNDDVVDLIEDLDEPAQERILEALDTEDRIAVEQSLSYPEYSAGRLMQPDVVSAPLHWTVGEMIDYLRSEEWLPDQFYHVILVDPRMKPKGYVTLGRVLSAKRDAKLIDIMEESFRTIAGTEPESEVAYVFKQYHLISLPVLDASGRLVGVITIDDALAVLDEEHEEDMLRMAGVGDESSISDGVWETLKSRFPWLGINLVTANMSALVIGLFDHTIATIVALAALMPIVASMGGNAGTQSLTVAVRALATRDLTASNAKRVVARELAVGVLNGIAFALVMGLVAWAFYGRDIWLGAVIGGAMIINLLVAAAAGVLIPLVLNRLKMDPALAAGTFVMTLTDVVGFFVFLGLATLVLL